LPSVDAWSGGEEIGKLREKYIQHSKPVFLRPTVKTVRAGGSMSVSFRPTRQDAVCRRLKELEFVILDVSLVVGKMET